MRQWRRHAPRSPGPAPSPYAADTAERAAALEASAARRYAEGDLEGSIAAWEQLHTLLLGLGDAEGAARAAAKVAVHLLIDTALMAPVRGWVRRAERLLEQRGEVPLHATLTAVRGYERFLCGDLDEAERCAAQAVALGGGTTTRRLRSWARPARPGSRCCAAGSARVSPSSRRWAPG